MEVVHSGFDKLKFTVQIYIPPEFRKALFEAKLNSISGNTETMIEIGGVALSVRRSGGMAFSAHTGEYGIEWHFVDPENRAPNNPGVTSEFRAFLLATGGLAAAKEHFETCMRAFGIRYVETQLRVSRVDFAIDILAPWFEPDRNCLVAPSRTNGSERANFNESETYSNGVRVTGLRVGAIANRQIAIYDKRSEIIQTNKMGWEKIWNASLAKAGWPRLDLKDRNQSQVWRFELCMGSKQLRNKWEMRSWDDLEAMVGDAFVLFCERIRYSNPAADTNRSRWQVHELWEVVKSVVASDLRDMRSGVLPDSIKTVNRAEHIRMLDGMILRLLVSRAAAEGVKDDEFDEFMKKYSIVWKQTSHKHPTPIDERLTKAAGKYRFR